MKQNMYSSGRESIWKTCMFKLERERERDYYSFINLIYMFPCIMIYENDQQDTTV
jgi:hypothetical protein